MDQPWRTRGCGSKHSVPKCVPACVCVCVSLSLSLSVCSHALLLKTCAHPLLRRSVQSFLRVDRSQTDYQHSCFRFKFPVRADNTRHLDPIPGFGGAKKQKRKNGRLLAEGKGLDRGMCVRSVRRRSVQGQGQDCGAGAAHRCACVCMCVHLDLRWRAGSDTMGGPRSAPFALLLLLAGGVRLLFFQRRQCRSVYKPPELPSGLSARAHTYAHALVLIWSRVHGS